LRDLSQKILDKFGITNLKPVSTPIISHYKLGDEQSPKTVEKQRYMDNLPFANLIGSIMYVMVCTHPNITFVVSL